MLGRKYSRRYQRHREYISSYKENVKGCLSDTSLPSCLMILLAKRDIGFITRKLTLQAHGIEFPSTKYCSISHYIFRFL